MSHVRQYRLSHDYSDHTGRALLASIQACDGFNRCLPATELYRSAASPDPFFFGAPAPAPRTTVEGTRFADVDGDGVPDRLSAYAHGGGKRWDARHLRGTPSTPVHVEVTPLGFATSARAS